MISCSLMLNRFCVLGWLWFSYEHIDVVLHGRLNKYDVDIPRHLWQYSRYNSCFHMLMNKNGSVNMTYYQMQCSQLDTSLHTPPAGRSGVAHVLPVCCVCSPHIWGVIGGSGGQGTRGGSSIPAAPSQTFHWVEWSQWWRGHQPAVSTHKYTWSEVQTMRKESQRCMWSTHLCATSLLIDVYMGQITHNYLIPPLPAVHHH